MEMLLGRWGKRGLHVRTLKVGVVNSQVGG